MTLVNFFPNSLHMDVLCVENHLNYTLAGIGNRLFVYEDQNLRLSERIFEGERIHSISVKNEAILLKGGRELALVSLEINSGLVKKCRIISKIQCSDWIQNVILIGEDSVGLVTAHNSFQLWDLKSRTCLKVFPSEETCILYSCRIFEESKGDAVVFSGTVFGDVLIWGPFLNNETSGLRRLKAHNGAVFSIEISNKIMTTTSDDRSLKIWSLITNKTIACPEDWKFVQIRLTHTLYGHTARVWRSLIISKFYVTIGEDSKLIIWSSNGKLVKSLSLHQESGIRALHYSADKNEIVTGGEDGGINRFSWESLTLETKALRVFTIDGNFSTRVCFIKNGIAYTQNGGCVLVSTTGEEFVYENENFQTYCLMEVAPSGDLIILGSIKGYVVVIDTRTKEVVTRGRFLDGRVYSLHCLDDHLLTCGPDGRLNLWKFCNEDLKSVKVMSLPNCKERWTTCGAVHEDRLVVGDRMGNLHVYDLTGGGDPVKSFRKAHSYLGVTDIAKDGNAVLTVGRDGTLKTFTEGFAHSLTHKLPMEWPWKILPYKGDKLILGFQSVCFVIWSTKHREIIASHDCGGGHRSCDFKSAGDRLTLMYVKEKKVFVVDLNLNEVTRIRNGFHGKEINCLRLVGPEMFVTGSEDTTLRIGRANGTNIEEMQVLKTHISSVRAVSTWEVGPREILIVSAGGKGQIVVWTFDPTAHGIRENVNLHLRKETRNWRCPSPDADPEMRIMCLDVTKSGNEFLIATGCSDRQIRIFSYEEDLTLICSASYTHCILNVKFLNADSRTFVASLGTDGGVVFWKVADGSVSQVRSFSLHQSGINSFQFEELAAGEFLLATGGDDNCISVSLVRVSGDEINVEKQWENKTAHSCQITGMKILKRFLVTTSIDQRITIWERRGNEGGFEMEFVNQYMSPVPDIQGMDARFSDDATMTIFVHGKGIEMLRAVVSSKTDVRHCGVNLLSSNDSQTCGP